MEPVVPADESNESGSNRGLLDKGTKREERERSKSEEEFDEDRPNVGQEERMFNLHGQGKPITEMNHSSNPGSDFKDY